MKPVVRQTCKDLTEMCEGYFESTAHLFRRRNLSHELILRDNGSRAPEMFIAIYNATEIGISYYRDLMDVAVYFMEEDPEGIISEDIDPEDYEIKLAYPPIGEIPDWGIEFSPAPTEQVVGYVGIYLVAWGS